MVLLWLGGPGLGEVHGRTALFWGEVRGSVDGGARKEVEGRAWGEGRRAVIRLGRNELINQLIKF